MYLVFELKATASANLLNKLEFLMHANELIHIKGRKERGKEKGEENTEQSLSSDKCELGFQGNGEILGGKETLGPS